MCRACRPRRPCRLGPARTELVAFDRRVPVARWQQGPAWAMPLASPRALKEPVALAQGRALKEPVACGAGAVPVRVRVAGILVEGRQWRGRPVVSRCSGAGGLRLRCGSGRASDAQISSGGGGAVCAGGDSAFSVGASAGLLGGASAADGVPTKVLKGSAAGAGGLPSVPGLRGSVSLPEGELSKLSVSMAPPCTGRPRPSWAACPFAAKL